MHSSTSFPSLLYREPNLLGVYTRQAGLQCMLMSPKSYPNPISHIHNAGYASTTPEFPLYRQPIPSCNPNMHKRNSNMHNNQNITPYNTASKILSLNPLTSSSLSHNR